MPKTINERKLAAISRVVNKAGAFEYHHMRNSIQSILVATKPETAERIADEYCKRYNKVLASGPGQIQLGEMPGVPSEFVVETPPAPPAKPPRYWEKNIPEEPDEG